MGIVSSIFGKKPKFVERSLGETRLLDQARSDLGSAQNRRPLLQAWLKGQGDPTAAEARNRGRANADVMQATSGGTVDPAQPQAAPIARATTRAKALARMGWAGANLAEEGAFHNRLAAAKFGKAVSRGSGEANSALSDLEYNHRALDNNLAAQRGAMVSNVVGTLAGAGIAGFGAWRDGRSAAANARGEPSSQFGAVRGGSLRLSDPAPYSSNRMNA